MLVCGSGEGCWPGPSGWRQTLWTAHCGMETKQQLFVEHRLCSHLPWSSFLGEVSAIKQRSISFVKKLHSKVWREEKRKTLEKPEMSTSFKKGNVIYEVRIKSTPRGKLVHGIFALPVQVARGLCTEQRSSWKGQSWRDKLLQRRICPVLTRNGETSSPSTLRMDAHSFPCYP